MRKKLQNGIGRQDWNGSLLAVLIARTLDFHWLGNNRFFCFDLTGKGEEEYAHNLGKNSWKQTEILLRLGTKES